MVRAQNARSQTETMFPAPDMEYTVAARIGLIVQYNARLRLAGGVPAAVVVVVVAVVLPGLIHNPK